MMPPPAIEQNYVSSILQTATLTSVIAIFQLSTI